MLQQLHLGSYLKGCKSKNLNLEIIKTLFKWHNSQFVFQLHLLIFFHQNSSAHIALKSKISKNHLIGQSIFMKMCNHLHVRFQIAMNQSPSNAKQTGYVTKMNDIVNSKVGNVILQIAIMSVTDAT